MEELRNAMRSLGIGSRENLENHLLRLSTWKELPVRVEKNSTGPAQLRASFNLPNLPLIELGARLTEEGRLTFDALPDVATRIELAERVARVEKKLETYRGRLELTRIQVVPSSSQLRLEFCAVEAARRDSPVVQGIIWELGPDGKGRVKLPDGFQVKGPRGLAPVSAPEKIPAPAEVILDAAWKHLRSAYPGLDGIVEPVVTPGPKGGNLLSLKLTVADLEILQLGQVEAYQVNNVSGLIDQLLSDETVCRAADRQWANHKALRSRMKKWNPSAVVALLAHEISLANDVRLPWDEEVTRQNKSWRRLSEDDINAMLFDKTEKLLDTATALRANLGSLFVRVGVNRNYFGEGRWLRLSRPAVALRVEMDIPVFSLSAGLENLVLDEEGLNWGQADYNLSWIDTISLPNFAVSDIEVHIRPKQCELEVTGCVTPPLPPGLAQASSKKVVPRTLRNPWLFVAFLKVAIKGRWEGPMLGGSAQVFVVRTKVADAEMNLDFNTEEFCARIRSGSALPGLEAIPLRLLGETKLSLKKRCLEAAVESSAGPLAFKGKVKSGLDKAGPYLAASGFIACGPGKVRLEGHIRDFVNDYALRGEAVLNLRLGKATVVFEIEPNGFRVYRLWEWEKGSPTLVYEKTSLQDAEPGELSAKLEGKGSGRATPQIREIVPPNHDPIVLPQDKEEERPSPETPSTGPLLPQRIARGDLNYDFKDGDVIVTEVKTKACLLRFPAASLKVPDPAECVFMCWRHQDKNYDLLVFAPSGERCVVHVRVWKDKAEEFHDLTEEYRELSADFFSEIPGRAIASIYAAGRHFELKTFPGHRAKPESIRKKADGYVLQYDQTSSESNKDLRHCQFIWVRDNRSHTAVIYAPFIAPEQRTDAFFQELSKRTTEANYVVIVAHDPANSRFSWLTRDGKGQWLLAPDAAKLEKVIPIHLVDRVSKLYQGAHALAEACFQPGGSARQVKQAWIGPQGVCAEADDGWLLIRLVETKQNAVHLTRTRFERWEKESKRFLAPEWRDPEDRKRLSAEAVARVAIADWQELRKANPDWDAANPLGLLLGLARPD